MAQDDTVIIFSFYLCLKLTSPNYAVAAFTVSEKSNYKHPYILTKGEVGDVKLV